MDSRTEALRYESELIEMRRYYHQHPEQSWQEFHTQQSIEEHLTAWGIPYETPYRTAVIATIKGAHASDRILGIRADIDALPVHEETGCAYCSQNEGTMHACGHDTHIAILLMTARILQEHRDELQETVRLIFQPAEEFIEDSGAYHLKDEPLVKACDRVIGLHVWGTLPAGQACIMDGPIMASADTFDVYIQGRGGHGAHPEQCIDPIAAGIEYCQSVNRVLARELSPLSPAVISITQFNAGTTSNVIPDSAHLSGTTRSADPQLREAFEGILNRIARAVSEDTGTTATVDYHYGCAVTVNDPAAAEMGRSAAANVFGEENVVQMPFLMGGEDFSKYTNEKAFLILGGGDQDPARQYAQHSPHFAIDERCLALGVAYFLEYVQQYGAAL